MTSPIQRPTGPQGLLFAETMKSLREFFEAQDHRPSADQWAALEDLAKHLQGAANGRLEERYYLSSLDPGIGKSQTIIHFLRALTRCVVYEDVGAIVCLSTLDEIRNMVGELGLPSRDVAILSSDKALNTLTEGHENPDAAQIILTTQQRIEYRLAGKEFATAREFLFNGKPRAVRVWDESFIPGKALTLSLPDMVVVCGRILRWDAPMGEALLTLAQEVRAAEDGSLFEVPDFAAKYDFDLNDALAKCDDHRDNGEKAFNSSLRESFTALWMLSGKTVRIRQDGNQGNAVLSYEDTIPADIAPLIITDASGRVRQTYQQMEDGRKNLVFLKGASKDYTNLTVHVWQRGGGKSAFEQHGGKLIDGIVDTIRDDSESRWLVVSHKPTKRLGDTAKRITSALGSTAKGNVEHLTWGNHRATNGFRDCTKLMLAGTLFYRASYYEALARLAMGKKPEAGVVSKVEREATAMGEHRHLLLQALCRGAVRKSEGAGCHPMDAYIICSVRSGIKEALQAVFPGCTVVDWRPVPDELSGHAKTVFEYVRRWFESVFYEEGERLKFTEIVKNTGVGRKVLTNHVRKDEGFREALAAVGIVEHGDGRYMTCYRKASDLR